MLSRIKEKRVLDKGHVPENLWKLSVTYLFEDTDFPFGGLQPRFCKKVVSSFDTFYMLACRQCSGEIEAMNFINEHIF